MQREWRMCLRRVYIVKMVCEAQNWRLWPRKHSDEKKKQNSTKRVLNNSWIGQKIVRWQSRVIFKQLILLKSLVLALTLLNENNKEDHLQNFFASHRETRGCKYSFFAPNHHGILKMAPEDMLRVITTFIQRRQ